MLKKLVNTTVEHIIRGDKSEEYRVKYIYMLFGITITKYDPIVFYNLDDATILASIGVAPSKIVQTDDYWGGGMFHSLGTKFHSGISKKYNIYRVFTKYDNTLQQCSACNIDEYRTVVNGGKLLHPLKPTYVYACIEQNKLNWFLAGNKNSSNISDAIWYTRRYEKNVSYVDCITTYIETFIGERFEYFKQEVQRIDDEAYKTRQKIENEISIKRQHETIASVREVFTNNIHTESFEHYAEQFVNNIENDKLKEQRNKVIKDELERINKYKAHLISLMH